MPATADADVIRRGYEAFSRGDMDSLRKDVFAPDVRWHQGGRNQTAGDYDGIDAVLGLFQKFFQLTDGTFRVAVHEILASDQHVVVLAAISGQRGGRSLGNGNYCQVFHMRDSRASEVWVTPVDPYELDAFWA
jgi:ketosteroid isomerase-like protein